MEKEEEQEYVMHVIRTGPTRDIKAKMEFLVGLKQIEQILVKVTWKKMNEALPRDGCMSKFQKRCRSAHLSVPPTG